MTTGSHPAPDALRTKHPASCAQIAGLASIGAGLIHAAAIGAHAEHPVLARLFVAAAAAQIAVGLVMLVRGGRLATASTALINAAAVAAWAFTRVAGISAIDGLEHAEAPELIDTVCAVLGSLAASGATWALARRRTEPTGHLGLPAVTVGALTVIAMMPGATHVHGHDNATDTAAPHQHAPTEHHGAHPAGAPPEAAAPHVTPRPVDPPVSDHHDDASSDVPTGNDMPATAWPRPWDPSGPVDFSGVPGVTTEQQARAEALVTRTLDVLPQFGDVSTLEPLGFHSIGDAATGYEHYLNLDYISDDAFLDPTKPESLVYKVDGDQRTLVSAMYIADQTPIDNPELIDYGGPLMQWHVHTNLCWAPNDQGVFQVVALTDDHGGTCPSDTIHAGDDSPMVHVWITPHDCGPFAALEGHGAGQTNTAPDQRTDLCADEHGNHNH